MCAFEQEATQQRASSSMAAAGRRRHSGALLRPSGFPWLIPALVLSVGVIYYSVAYTGYISALDWDGISVRQKFVGAENYLDLFSDGVFWRAIQNTVVFFLVTYAVQTAIGFTLATLLHSRVRLSVLYRVLIFVPVVIAPAIMAPVFRQMFSADGDVNELLELVGLGSVAQPWLAQSGTALPVIMLVTMWQWTGLTFVLYYAAISQIEPEVVEAARIDGASNLSVTKSIIWPGVRGTTVALAILSVIGALKTFDVPWLVTIGGPNYATEFLGTYIYRISIPQAHVGYGAAISIVLLALAIGTSIVVMLRLRRGAH